MVLLKINHVPLVQVTIFIVLVVSFQIAIAKFTLQKETKRRIQHALTGHALVLISYVLIWEACVVGLGIGCWGIAYLRYYQHDLYVSLFGSLLRTHELSSRSGVLPGAFWFLFGTLCCVCVFPMPVARYAVACLSWADPLASWAGTSITEPRMMRIMIHPSASLAGCSTSFLTAVLLGVAWFDLPWSTAAAGGLACSVAEAFPLWNDNFSIPLATASAVVVANSLRS